MRPAALLLALTLLAGCRDVDRVVVFFSFCGGPEPVFSVGDTVRVSAEAHSDEGFVFGTFLYSSDSRPGAFSWRVTPESAATYLSGSRLAVLRPGRGQVWAASKGVVGSIEYSARMPTVAVEVQAPARIRRGDTLTVRFAARDGAGETIEIDDRPVVLMLPSGRVQSLPADRRDEVRGIATSTGRVTVWWCHGGRAGQFPLDVGAP